MLIPEKLKLNKFVPVKLPKAKEFWDRIRLANNFIEPQAGAFSGDEIIDLGDGNKTDLLDIARITEEEERLRDEQQLAIEEAESNQN